ncbi:tetracycline resistance protein (plasmid) [Ruegeria pomeroyi DSS-3]|uniref:Tetracycline resistance protein n=2 Tax=Ruegeria pomeroyi TaxID=89184 RepID=Q5LKF0_RUEPO|nr:tetracycline resistance MFS efflux pump [Ruegeria pomeroyi]AAV97562.1 tetracycline resistance protein [Ruegeria pomeroyi DSS-3]NVK95522.1 tetracycline resistance MFS efflux pump [Ruegeria pomeroyi]NVK99830.1 tetracycline resistance MFS efflux pump [Ruegeria pomeroyi]HCE71002.1 tetracycline resistance MFS efflux pump [Ruegeria sp.]
MRLPFLFILATVMIDAMGIGLIMPIMPDLIVEVKGGTLADAALWGGVLSTAFAAMQFLFGPVIGSLSDALGRRPVLLVSLFVMALDYVVMALAGSIWLLLAGRIVGGITAATHATASAYMADVSRPEQKAARFGMLGAAFGVGFVLGPLMGGVLGEFGTRAPFWAAAVLAGLNFVLGLFVMNETVTAATRRAFSWASANPLGAFRMLGQVPGLKGLLWAYFLYSVAIYVYPAIWAYFSQERFGWSSRMIGLSLGIFGFLMAVVQGGLLPHITRRIGERRTVIWGQLFDFVGFGLLAFIASGTLALILIPITAMGAVVPPALQAIMSRSVADDQQGALQGVMSAVHALSMIVSPLLMASVFARFTGPQAPIYLPGAPFLVALALMAAGLVIFLRTRTAVT